MQNLLQHQSNRIDELKETLRLEELRASIIANKFASVDENKIKQCFKKIGCEEIKERVSARFRDVNSSLGSRATEEELLNAELLISYRVKSISIKPIAFAGYTASGDGKNRDRLNKKAQKLEEKIEKLTGYKCSLNPYDFEVKNIGDDFCFSIDFRF